MARRVVAGSKTSAHHSHTWPATWYSPKPFGAKERTGALAAYGGGALVHRLYQFGHDRDPRAAIHIEPFSPPMLGYNQIAQFATLSYFSRPPSSSPTCARAAAPPPRPA